MMTSTVRAVSTRRCICPKTDSMATAVSTIRLQCSMQTILCSISIQSLNVLGFSALDADGDDVTDMLLNTENLLMFTSNDLTKVSAKEWDKVKEITNYAENRGYIVVWTVANEAEYVEYLRTKYDFLNEVFYADELEIKTIVRSNPGLIWLDNGLVKDKWSSVDFKKVLKAL